MLFDPARHEALLPIEWDEKRVRAAIAHIARDTQERYSEATYWPSHPLDLDEGDDPNLPATSLYFGACGVIWALHYLEAGGAARLSRSYLSGLESLLTRNRAWLKSFGSSAFGSYMMGDIPMLMLAFGNTPTAELGDRLAASIAGNVASPARELMWGSPGTMLAALFLYGTGGNGYAFLKLYQRTDDSRWLARARAFAMHGIAQTETEARRRQQMRYSLWTGDPGFAIYLWDCLHGAARFPTLDVYYGDRQA